MGGAASGAVNAVSGFVNKAGGLAGTGGDAGILGVGQYKGKEYDVNKDAFYNADSEKKRQEEFARQLAASQNRQAQQARAVTTNAATINQNPQAQFRTGQEQLAAQLQAQSAGQGPSLAQSQLRQATDRNIQQAMALAASQRGANPALGLRQAQMAMAGANQQAAAQAADLRMQEQMAARQQLAGVLGSARGQDIGLATEQAGLQQQANMANMQAQNQMALANQQAALQQQALNDQQARFYNTGLMDLDQKIKNDQMAYEQVRVNQQTGLNQANQAGYQAASQARGNLVGGLGQGIAAIAMSDEDKKKDIKDGSNKTMKMLDEISKGMAGPAATGGSNPYQGLNNAGQAMGKGIGTMLGLGPKTPVAADPTLAAPNVGPAIGSLPEMALPAMGPSVAPAAAAAAPSLASAAPMAAAAASDEKLKKDVSGGDDKLRAFVDALKAHEYKYKNPKHGDGTYVSPMAQEIEKTELGKDMVVNTPEGKMVDYARAGGTMLAAAAMINDRVSDLEKRFGDALAKSKRGK